MKFDANEFENERDAEVIKDFIEWLKSKGIFASKAGRITGSYEPGWYNIDEILELSKLFYSQTII